MELYSYGPLPAQARADAIPRGVAGLSVLTTWGVLQPSVTRPVDWTLIDKAVGVARNAGLKLYLRVQAGEGCPSDLPGQVTVPGSCFGHGPKTPKSVTMPLPNDATFLRAWTGFITAFGVQYHAEAVIDRVAMCGGSRQGEMILPTCSQWNVLAARHGLTAATLLGSWQTIIEAWRSAFPEKTTTLGIENPMGILATLLDWIQTRYGANDGIDIQQNGLCADTDPKQNLLTAPHQMGFTTGWQTWGDVAQGTGPLAKTLAVAAQSGASYVELYAQDVMDTKNDPLFLTYGS